MLKVLGHQADFFIIKVESPPNKPHESTEPEAGILNLFFLGELSRGWNFSIACYMLRAEPERENLENNINKWKGHTHSLSLLSYGK